VQDYSLFDLQVTLIKAEPVGITFCCGITAGEVLEIEAQLFQLCLFYFGRAVLIELF